MKKTRKMVQHMLLVVAGLLCVATANAYDFKAENEDGVTIYYNVTNNNEAVVTSGYFITNDARYTGDIVIPSAVSIDGQMKSVVGIGISAFANCYGLTSIVIPNTITYIENSAFSGCSALDNVVLPYSINSLGNGVFYGCTNLKSITSQIAEPFPVSTTTFYTMTNTTLYVPAGTKAAYEATVGWNIFESIIEVQNENAPLLTVSDATLSPGQKQVVNFGISNGETPIIGFQFDMTLPEGIIRTSFDDGYGGKIDRDRCPDFTGKITSSPSDGIYTFVAYSESNLPMAGSEGTVLSIMLLADENISLGTYQGTLSNIILVKDDNSKIYLDDVTFNIVVKKSILKGDVNGDGSVDVQDITEIAKYIVRQTNEIDSDAADMDGDGVIDVADITLVVKVIMEAKPSSSRLLENAVTTSDNLSLLSMGEGKYGINLTNNEAYVASQLDIKLPKGSTINLEKSDRCENHQLSFEKVDEDTYRVIIYSLNNEVYAGNDGVLLTMSVDGSSEGMVLENTLFVNDKHNKSFFGTIPMTAGIQAVNMDSTSNSIYTLDGRKVNPGCNLVKGVYIINGKKVVIE